MISHEYTSVEIENLTVNIELEDGHALRCYYIHPSDLNQPIVTQTLI